MITAASTAQAQKLKGQLVSVNIILGDYLQLPEFMLSTALIKLPNPASFSYTHEMLALCLDKQIDTIYTLRDEELSLLKESKLLFEEYGITVVHD